MLFILIFHEEAYSWWHNLPPLSLKIGILRRSKRKLIPELQIKIAKFDENGLFACLDVAPTFRIHHLTNRRPLPHEIYRNYHIGDLWQQQKQVQVRRLNLQFPQYIRPGRR